MNSFLLDLDSDLRKFESIYSLRPIIENSGGMGFNHSFALWKMLTTLKPDVVVESGIWKGHSTWLIEQALPDARVISFDTKMSMRRYTSSRVTYIESDFQFYDWSSENLTNSLIFFDDHQNTYSRIVLASFFGFKKFIFEDNYNSNDGDFYSLNHLFSGSGFTDIQMSKKHRRQFRSILKRIWYLPVLRRTGSSQNWLIPKNSFDSKNLQSRLKQMFVFPRVFQSNGEVDPELPTLISSVLPNMTGSSFDFSYNNITYLEIQ